MATLNAQRHDFKKMLTVREERKNKKRSSVRPTTTEPTIMQFLSYFKSECHRTCIYDSISPFYFLFFNSITSCSSGFFCFCFISFERISNTIYARASKNYNTLQSILSCVYRPKDELFKIHFYIKSFTHCAMNRQVLDSQRSKKKTTHIVINKIVIFCIQRDTKKEIKSFELSCNFIVLIALLHCSMMHKTCNGIFNHNYRQLTTSVNSIRIVVAILCCLCAFFFFDSLQSCFNFFFLRSHFVLLLFCDVEHFLFDLLCKVVRFIVTCYLQCICFFFLFCRHK